MAKLFWLQPDNTIVEFPLKAEQNLIGRGSRCDVRIKHPGISAEHALIRQVSGVATVEDLASTNGTRVNGKRLAHMHTLRHGDQIGVGRERLMYFAELDSAASFLQPQSIEPFAIPAPIRERVNTDSGANSAAALTASLPAAAPAPQSPLGDEPVLDGSMLAALPKGTRLPSGGPPIAALAAAHARTAIPVATRTPSAVAESSMPLPGVPVATIAQTATPTPLLEASVSVLSGPAAGKRYMLTAASVTMGKEGRQVVEFVRVSPNRWQILQREGTTPAYINGDALTGPRELAAGDVIELAGVRLRFEISLAKQ